MHMVEGLKDSMAELIKKTCAAQIYCLVILAPKWGTLVKWTEKELAHAARQGGVQESEERELEVECTFRW